MSDTHTLVVTMHSDCLDMEPTDVDYAVECPGVTTACAEWVLCKVAECPGNNGGDDTLYDVSNVAHGVEHRYVDSSSGGFWGVQSGACYIVGADEMPDAADYLATKEELGAGRYLVGHDFDEGRIADFQLIGVESAR